MAQRLPITIRVDQFEGPLDLLLYLIQSHELDISKISISRITDQYLSYVRLMQELNFDIASEFLVMAATLLHWKSKALLPKEEGPTDGKTEDGALTQEELLRQLLEHQRFLAAGQDLAQLPLLGDDVFARQNLKTPVEKVWKTMEVTSIALCFQDILIRARKRTQILKKETVSLAERIGDFGRLLPLGVPTEFSRLMSSPTPARPEVVVTFLASLELSRLRKMRVHQQKTYDTIYLELLESLENFNLQLATGFDAVAETIEASLAAPAQEVTTPPAADLASAASSLGITHNATPSGDSVAHA